MSNNMTVMAKPVNRVMVTSEEEAAKILKSFDPTIIQRILKNAERINKQFANSNRGVL